MYNGGNKAVPEVEQGQAKELVPLPLPAPVRLGQMEELERRQKTYLPKSWQEGWCTHTSTGAVLDCADPSE